MTNNEKFTFEEIYNQNKNRIHYQLHKLGIQDPHNEFYTEGLYAMWMAHKKYEPNKGPMATYFNYQIRYRLIDKLRKQASDITNEEKATEEQKNTLDDGNRFGLMKFPVVDKEGITVDDHTFWKRVRACLSDNQWKWVSFYIIHGMSQKEIAEHENVSIEAVKSWAKEARRKLRAEEERLRDG